MAGPKTDLTDLLKKTGNVEIPNLDSEPEKGNSLGSSREGKKVMQGHFGREEHRKMKILCATEETTIQNLLEEAVELLFDKYDV